MVQKHWGHVNNYEDFVRFVGEELEDLVFNEYLKLAGHHKNATYLSKFTVSKFLEVKWIEQETVKKIREAEYFTLLLDDSTDNANRSELSLIARAVDEDGCIQTHFLTLIQLQRCDALSIFTAVYDYLEAKEIDITRMSFSGLDGCSTMMGVHSGVQAHFKKRCSHH